MDAIVNFLEGIGNILKLIGDFLVSSIEDTLFIVETGGKIILGLQGNIWGWLPVEVVSTIAAILGIVLLYKILGRE